MVIRYEYTFITNSIKYKHVKIWAFDEIDAIEKFKKFHPNLKIINSFQTMGYF